VDVNSGARAKLVVMRWIALLMSATVALSGQTADDLKTAIEDGYRGIWYMNQPLKLDHLWAGLCLVGAVYFIFRS